MRRSGNYPPLAKKDDAKRAKYFREFIKSLRQETKEARVFRKERLALAQKVRQQQVDSLPEEDVRDFFMRLHSVGVGSGAGIRKKTVARTKLKYLEDLLTRLSDERTPVEEGIASALISRQKHGIAVKNLGPACIQEIPGWLFPDRYPIINGKFYKTLAHLGLQVSNRV